MTQKTFEIFDGGDINSLEEWVHEQARELWKDPNDSFRVTVSCEVVKQSYQSRWSQTVMPYSAFRRKTCPICGTVIPPDDSRDGYPESTVQCPTDRSHYRFSYNLFGDYLTVGGKNFDGVEDKREIDEHLDKVGNKEFMR